MATWASPLGPGSGNHRATSVLRSQVAGPRISDGHPLPAVASLLSCSCLHLDHLSPEMPSTCPDALGPGGTVLVSDSNPTPHPEREMANIWNSKVLPKIKKVFGSNGTKKAAVAETIKSFDESKFPGSKPVSEAAAKYAPAYVSGPVTFILDKVSGLLPAEEAAATAEAPADAESSSKEATAEVIEEIKKEEAEKVEETPAPATETPAPAPAPAPAPEPAKA
ncbi:hypothetical protein B296_00036787 [Ensete ventricosum]|uniref:Uncharacterized protein n=1 Tax=Ensete ventricosum TaxID=4639 RepID=A0A426YDV7_ENSVE|nr:hypothetical protein B296_00036787 [Ensete ventricosum]